VHFPHSLWSQFAVKIQYVHFPYSLWSQFAGKIQSDYFSYSLCIFLPVCAFSSQSVLALWCQYGVCGHSVVSIFYFLLYYTPSYLFPGSLWVSVQNTNSDWRVGLSDIWKSFAVLTIKDVHDLSYRCSYVLDFFVSRMSLHAF
jgi:hypothetical protein